MPIHSLHNCIHYIDLPPKLIAGSCAGCIGNPANGNGCGAADMSPWLSGNPRALLPSRSSSNMFPTEADGGSKESIKSGVRVAIISEQR